MAGEVVPDNSSGHIPQIPLLAALDSRIPGAMHLKLQGVAEHGFMASRLHILMPTAGMLLCD
jgi:hypothetical protein